MFKVVFNHISKNKVAQNHLPNRFHTAFKRTTILNQWLPSHTHKFLAFNILSHIETAPNLMFYAICKVDFFNKNI